MGSKRKKTKNRQHTDNPPNEFVDQDVNFESLYSIQSLYIQELLNTAPGFSSGFLNVGEYNSWQPVGERANYQSYEIMDNADGSAALDIYAASVIIPNSMKQWRPFGLEIKGVRKSIRIPKELMMFIEHNERNCSLFKTLYGVVRDGCKFGVSYEKMRFKPSLTFMGKSIFDRFESLATPDVFPLHGDNKTEITEYLHVEDTHDYYHRKNFIQDDNKDKKTNVSSQNIKGKFYKPKIILSFIRSDRSFDYVGKSIFLPVLETFNSSKISEGKLLTQRITRSAEKIVHALEGRGKSDAYLKAKAKLIREINKSKRVIRELSTKFVQQQKDITGDDDIISLTYDGKGGVSSIGGSGDISSIRDIDHWRHQFYTTLHIPPYYTLDSTLKNASRDAVAEMDKLFGQIISEERIKLEQSFLIRFYQMCIDLYYNEVGAYKNFVIDFSWHPISNLEQLRQEKMLQIKMTIAKMARLELELPEKFIYKRYLGYSDSDIKEIEKLPRPTLNTKPQDEPKTTDEAFKQVMQELDDVGNIFSDKQLTEIQSLVEGIFNESGRIA
jgi:hypothetical protein